MSGVKFTDILAKYRSESYSERDKGTRFEELMTRYFMTDPTYASVLEWTVPWGEFFARKDLGGQDTGIDLVAKTQKGEYWAIQCKCYAEGHAVSKKDMDTFLATSGRTFRNTDGNPVGFSQRIIVATTDEWGKNAEEVASNQTIPVSIITLSKLIEAPVDWEEIEKGAHGEGARAAKHQLREHQEKALDAALAHYKDNDRGRMIMACGTGKTFTSLKIAEALLKRDKKENGGLVLFFAPSIALVGQTLREWMANTDLKVTPVCVCSDATVSKKSVSDELGDRVEYLGMPATTDPGRIAFSVAAEGATVVFSTYQSIDSIIEAQKIGLPEFDLIVCDEAHRTTGAILSKEDESSFTKVHDNSLVHGRKRLYMTATPRLYGVKGKEDAVKNSIVLCSMDDEKIYGKEFYHLSFGEAVSLNLLSDYKVLILTTPEDGVPDIVKKHWTDFNNDKTIDVDGSCKVWGTLNALAKNVAYDSTLKEADPAPMKSAVIFCRTISSSKGYAEGFNQMASGPMSPRKLEVRHIDGSFTAMNRERLMNWLKAGDEDGGCRALTNVRCLSEGVDVPALDAVVFMTSKGSMVDVVQSVGRVMRKAEGKKYGYIIIPIVVPESEDPDEALNNNERYKVVWDVLRALRSHDERIEAEINTFPLRKNNQGGHIHIARPYGPGWEMGDPITGAELLESGQYTLDDFGGALLARLVIKVGDREYIENWAANVAKIMPALTEQLKKICQHEEKGYKQYKPAFNRYLKGLRECVNDNVSEKAAINMLAQQVVTKPIFNELFAKDGFVMNNSVFQTIDAMLTEIDAKNGLKDIDSELHGFYDSVKNTLSQIDTNQGRQKVITALYEKFFKIAFPKDQAINGIVYTPVEIVDFIINSCAEALKDEFGIDINDEDVNVLDPFTGTGTFIARLLESGIINQDNIFRKYTGELFANEITLLAYYIALVNIENTFARVSGVNRYVQFDNILLTDTFNIDRICNEDTVQTQLDGDAYFRRNKGRIRREHDKPITIIFGNPPYGAVQKSANDNAKKRTYEGGIDDRIKETYLNEAVMNGASSNVNSVYDNYIRAFRWASDRIGNNDGIISFVTPNGWLASSAFTGFRRCLESEFFEVFVLNLRGDQNSSNWKEEGEKVFGQGSKIGIAITMLVKKRDFKGKAKIHYYAVADGLKRKEKFNVLTMNRSFSSMHSTKKMITLEPKTNGDWIVERNDAFQQMIPLTGDVHKKFDKFDEKTIFVGYSIGYQTNKDVWSYNFNKKSLNDNISSMIDEYNRQTKNGVIIYDSKKIKWDSSLESHSRSKDYVIFDESKLCKAAYRPFTKKWYYNDNITTHRTAQMPHIYPMNTENLTICVSGVAVKKDFSCLMTDIRTDSEIVGKSQCMPLYWYEDYSETRRKTKQTTLDGSESSGIVRHDGISDYAQRTVSKKYGKEIQKKDIFYYVYGYLHSPIYRKTFSDDLKYELPRIDFVDSYQNFEAFVNAGKKLADLHLHYENAPACPDVTFSNGMTLDEILNADEKALKVTKMKLDPEKRCLIYNNLITIENIPEDAFRYVVNGRTALGWLVDQYQVTTDKESGIVNDPNEYAGPAYILKLVLSVITVSVETMKIVDSLPKLDFGGNEEEEKETS